MYHILCCASDLMSFSLQEWLDSGAFPGDLQRQRLLSSQQRAEDVAGGAAKGTAH